MNKIILFCLFLFVQQFAQTVPVTFIYKPTVSSFSTVRLAGSFNSWSTTNSAYLMSYDTGFNAYKITVNLSPAVYQYKFVVDASWFADPNNPITDGSMYGNSQITVTDPLIMYFWPTDTTLTTIADVQPIKAICAFSSSGITVNNFSLTINGNPVITSAANYDTLRRMFTYKILPGDVITGRNVVNLTLTTPKGSKTKSTILNITLQPRLEVQTENITYKKAAIMYYGKVGNDSILSFSASLNGTPLGTLIQPDKTFRTPITLQRGSNILNAALTSTFGTTLRTDTIIYKPDIQPVVQVIPAVSDRQLTVTIAASSPLSLPLYYQWFESAGNPVKLLTGNETAQVLQVNIPQVNGEYIFKSRITDAEGNHTIGGCLVRSYPDSVHIMQLHEHASWIDSLVLYEVFTPTYGQTQKGLKGVIEKLDHIADIGATAVWLTPIFDGDSSHGYSTRDYYKVNAAFGSETDLRNLVNAAHARGLRVILDLVINHTWDQHPFFRNVQTLKANSPFANYYIWTGTPGSSSYMYYYDWTTLPNLNFNNPEVTDYLLNMAAYWVKEFDIDGYRCDVAWGIEIRNSQFWKIMRSELRKIKPEIFLLAESPADNNFSGQTLDIFNYKFDAAYDWNLMGDAAGALYNTLKGTANVPLLNSVVAKTYPANSYPLRFCENHDIARLASAFSTAKSKLAHSVTATINGIPLIYGGAEVGELTQRNKINWTDPASLKPYFKKLLQIRKQFLLNNASFTNLSNSVPNTVYSYVSRSDSNTVLAVANFSNSSSTVTVNLSTVLNGGNHVLYDLLQSGALSVAADQVSAYPFSLAANEIKLYLIDRNPSGTETVSNMPVAFQLEQNYPNPFNPATIIAFTLPAREHVSVAIYNALGEKVTELVHAELEAGRHSYSWDAGSLASGVYICHLRSANYSAVQKMLLLK